MSDGIKTLPAVLFAALTLGLSAPGAAHDDIQLLSAASMQTVFKEVLPDFERSTGNKVTVRYSTMGAITGRVAGGERADLVISSPASISSLVAQGKIKPGSEIQIAKTGVGAVVPEGTPAPRIESADDFTRALLAAKVVVYANPAGGGAAGIHIARLIEKLGLTEQLKAKTVYGAGGDVAEVTVAQGRGALGLTQVSEIVGKPGMQFVPLPEALQNYTGFVAGIPADAKPSAATSALLAYLRTPAAAAVMNEKGMLVDAPVVVFVCEHGSSRSVMAAELFNRKAEQRGVAVRAVSRAASVETVDQKVPDQLARNMAGEGFSVAGFKPQPIGAAEASKATRVVTLAYDKPLDAGGASLERWSDIGSPGREYRKTMDAISSHVDTLLDELGKK